MVKDCNSQVTESTLVALATRAGVVCISELASVHTGGFGKGGGTPGPGGTPPPPVLKMSPFSALFSGCVFGAFRDDFGSDFGPIWASFWRCFCITFRSLDLALNFVDFVDVLEGIFGCFSTFFLSICWSRKTFKFDDPYEGFAWF